MVTNAAPHVPPNVQSDRPLDPEVAVNLRYLPAELLTSVRPEGISGLRAAVAALARAVSPDAGTLDYVVPGAHEVPLRVHRPRQRTVNLPCLYWIHSGGYIFGSHTDDDAILQRWAETFDCIVVSVGYRLAPEHPYPAASDDCLAGLVWAYENASELGFAPSRLGIAGRSAGAGLAASLALRVRDQTRFQPIFQALLQPMLDDRRVTESSRWMVPVWDAVTNTTGWQSYLGDLFGGEVPAYAAAARATDLIGLPPAYIAIGGADIFVDEAVAYSRALTHAKVATDLRVYAAACHGFDQLAPESAVAKRAQRDFEEWLVQALTGGSS